jgi:hypothetical protein
MPSSCVSPCPTREKRSYGVSRHPSLLSLDLCQCGLRSGQQEGHRHGEEKLAGAGPFDPSLLKTAGFATELPEFKVVVGRHLLGGFFGTEDMCDTEPCDLKYTS